MFNSVKSNKVSEHIVEQIRKAIYEGAVKKWWSTFERSKRISLLLTKRSILKNQVFIKRA